MTRFPSHTDRLKFYEQLIILREMTNKTKQVSFYLIEITSMKMNCMFPFTFS